MHCIAPRREDAPELRRQDASRRDTSPFGLPTRCARLSVRMTTAYDGGPLGVLAGLPADGAELRPQQLRALAQALVGVASDLERRKTTHRGRPLPDETRSYATNC